LKTNYSISQLSLKKLAILFLLAATTIGAFATLGTPGRGGKQKAGKSLLTAKSTTYTGTFSLQSGYNFRGNRVINTQENKYINLNTVVTYQQGHTTYIMPLKKRVALNGKITFNPNAATR
jgi:antitoxin component YwqK of YwqJK toxin-antitoxin module